MFARKVPSPDRRPPLSPAVLPTLGACVRCGEPVAPTDGMHGRMAEGVRHFVCDVATRDGVTRQIEAMRALHRAIKALAHLPGPKAQLEMQLAALPDVTEVGAVIEVLSRTRVSVECARNVPSEQRRLALSYLDAMLRKLSS